MNTLAFTRPSMTLPLGETHTLRHHAGARIEVVSGRVWLTEPGDLDDHFVAGGESLLLRQDGPVVIQSDGAGAAVLRIVSAQVH